MLAYPKLARVLFDESHSEAWTIRGDVARRMQPAHPADSSLAAAASALTERDFEAAAHLEGPIDADALAGADVLVLAHPSDPKWEATTGSGEPRLTDAEIDAIEGFVSAGGGLIVLGETEQDKYGNNLNELLARFGMRIANETVQDYEHNHGAPTWVLAELADSRPDSGADPLVGVAEACFYRAGTLECRNGSRVLARARETASHPGAALAAIARHGKGRVACLADSDLFGDDCIAELSHAQLWLNLVYWVSEGRFRRPGPKLEAPLTGDPAWLELKLAAQELRLRQKPDGSIDAADGDSPRLRELVETIARSAVELKPRFPHQHAYIDALCADLVAWADGGFERPDFGASMEAFRPELDRRDGITHLVVFPMYKQNASRDTCFEALLVRVPWPDWIAEIESRYDNRKFVPVELLDFTPGYDSECAVLFPETFSFAERPAEYHFGAIFCDREAERLRRVGSAAAEALRLNLPPDAAALLASPQLSRDTFILWDLLHDRTHMRGELPFDPFMIRQRSPYWMYALEELRCDLTAFAEARTLEREGFAFARHLQYAVIFDRMFRFPLTGDRVRNYDGLGGQLLFAFLHREGYLNWSDSRLEVDWKRVGEGVEALRARIQNLYRTGIDRPKLNQWTAAHDLVAEYVPAAEFSVWAKDRRVLPDVGEPRELVDLVRDDEFPLSLFFTQLAPRLEPALARAARR
ncbi:MAG: DUF6421 family protein [Actinomycetota bacterium]|nr:DUF6421 family protein [Actinomycetota bacterium]